MTNIMRDGFVEKFFRVIPLFVVESLFSFAYFSVSTHCFLCYMLIIPNN